MVAAYKPHLVSVCLIASEPYYLPTVFTRKSAVVFMTFFDLWMRRLFKGGACNKVRLREGLLEQLIDFGLDPELDSSA